MGPEHGIRALAAAIRAGQLSPVDVVRTALERIQADRHLNAYALVCGDEAIAAARDAERELREGIDHGPLHGLPVAVKDNIDTAGIRTTGGSAAYRDRTPSTSAPVWQRLQAAGAVLVGKTNLHELAYTAPHPDFGATRNPYAPDHAPGGSSSGSGVAVAAGHVVATLGTDTGGSVRQPAAFCGVVGLKPSPDLLSNLGIFPLAWTLDTPGVLARRAEEVSIVLALLTPALPSEPEPPVVERIGLVRPQPDAAPVDEHTLAALYAAADRLRAAGYTVEEIDLPPLGRWHAVHRVIIAAEAYAANQDTLTRTPELHGPHFRDAVLPGANISAADYLRAQHQQRAEIRQAMREIFRRYSTLLLPVAPSPAPPLDPLTGRAIGEHLTRWTFFANLAGLPALSIPQGLIPAGLPRAVQLLGPPCSDARLLRLARATLGADEPLPLPPVRTID